MFSLIAILITKSIAFDKRGDNYANRGEIRRFTNNDNNFGNSKSGFTGGQSYSFSDFGQRSDGTQAIQSKTKGHSGVSAKTRSPISIAVKTRRTIEVIPVQFEEEEEIEPQIIEITSNSIPLKLHFKSQSSRLSVRQSHIPSSPQKVEEISTQDEPYRLVHEVLKPVIQEVREVIQPYRNVVQTIKPVIENLNTIVSKEEERIHSNSGGHTNPIQGIQDNNHKNSKTGSGRSSSSFDSVYSHKNFDPSISQKTIDSDMSHVSYDSGSGYASTNSVIYRIAPLIRRRSGNFEDSDTSSNENQNSDFIHQYFSIYPDFRFL